MPRSRLPRAPGGPVHITCPGGVPLRELVRRVLDHLPFRPQLRDGAGDAARVADATKRLLADQGQSRSGTPRRVACGPAR